MDKISKNIAPQPDRFHELRTRLAAAIASVIHSQENLTTDIPGLQMFRRTAPTAPATATYEPSLAVVAQGRKRADLGRTSFIFDESRFLLTSLDLPVISQVIEASEEKPYLCFFLKLEMPVVRELLSGQEIQAVPSDDPAMATGETTSELLDACCRLVDLLNTPQDIPVAERPDSTRDHLPNPPRAGGRASSRDCDARRPEPPDGEGHRLGEGELREAAARGRSSKDRGHGRLHATPAFPGAHRYEPSSVSEATPAAFRKRAHAHG